MEKIKVYHRENCKMSGINFDNIPPSEKTCVVAMGIYPYASKQSARRLLTNYINSHQELQNTLESLGFSVSDKIIYRPHIIAIYNSMGLLVD